ncbi:Uncharacterised protein [Clostridioides difficile]|nr:Uncharacterised protein [Clostridioides difficile]VIB35032.1 Uncharacterised protein [Clostridioides difficile]
MKPFSRTIYALSINLFALFCISSSAMCRNTSSIFTSPTYLRSTTMRVGLGALLLPFIFFSFMHFLPSCKKDSYKPLLANCPLAVIMTVHFSSCSDCADSARLLGSWQAFFCYAQ